MTNHFSKNTLFTFLATIILFYSCSEKRSLEENIPEIKMDSFGFAVDSFNVKKIKVAKNKTLTDILLPANIEYKEILKIANYSKEIFDVRKIKPNSNFYYYMSNDSSLAPQHLIYQDDLLNYTFINLSDSFYIEKRYKEITIKERVVFAEIKSSLFNALAEENVNDNLALKLSEVYAWQIDFYRLYMGDSFIVCFEEEYVDDKFYRIGKILSSKFLHQNKNYTAILFNKAGRQEYFDDEGKSLTKQFLRTPVKFSRISSTYSRKRLHPVLKTYRPHLGTDFAATIGTPIRVIGDGVVEFAGRNGGSGIYIKVRHNSIYSSGYLHMSRIAAGIKRRVQVVQGQVIGYVGQTGLASGPHLDLRFWKNGKLINFLKAEFPSNKNISNDDIDEFKKVKNKYISKLNLLKSKKSSAM